MVELNAEQLRELLGAYALDAVDEEERVEIERFLARDARARAEVAEYRELAALIANAGGDAPVGVWNRITGAIHGDAPTMPPPRRAASQHPAISDVDGVRRRRKSKALRVVAAIAAIGAAAAVALGIRVSQQDHHIDTLSRALGETGALQRAYAAARVDPGAKSVVLSQPDGVPTAHVVLLRDGSGYFAGERLAPLAQGRTYQLWALVGDPANPTAVSAGVLGPAPRLAAFRYDGRVIGFAITEEHDPGVVISQNQPVAVGKFV